MRALEFLPLPKRVQALLLLGVIGAGIGLPARAALAPAKVRAHDVPAPVQVGTSFSPRHAEELGLDYQVAFKRLAAMHFRVIRLSAYWDEIDDRGYGRLDWLMAEALQRHQPVVLSVGMKGLGWPEFYIPPGYQPVDLADGHDVMEDQGLTYPTLVFIKETVNRYRGNAALVAWQVENEPFNRAGPHRWYIDPVFVREEIATVRALDTRPLIVNVFGHFNMLFDQASSRRGLDFKSLLGFDADQAERDSLGVLASGDILGLDIYTGIGYSFLAQEHVSRAGSDWSDQVGQWREVARNQRKQAWITEAQAEPWEASGQTYASPRSFGPDEIEKTFDELKDQGYTTILLWGSEYWLWRAEAGDTRWLQSVERILDEEARARALIRF
jgi:hypothetical protein